MTQPGKEDPMVDYYPYPMVDLNVRCLGQIDDIAWISSTDDGMQTVIR